MELKTERLKSQEELDKQRANKWPQELLGRSEEKLGKNF
jgi:hypothetical protein